VYLMLALVPGLAWLPKDRFHLDADKPAHAIACGLTVSGLNVAAGVSGPLLDVFFVRTLLTRHQVVATKAATQAFSHTIKMAFYGLPMIVTPPWPHADTTLAAGSDLPPWWFFAIATPLAMLGAVIGGRILDRFSDASFQTWSRWIVTAVGVLYLIQAATLFAN